ncbi:MAG: DMT family transporter [Thermoanaerobaculia bacterium]|nr:DMT family transporter [Thermoanaerobaculia bacterium]
MLVGVTLVWGSSFIVVNRVLETAPPLAFLFARFMLATLLLAPFVWKRARTPGLLRDGLVLGLLLAGGMSLQVIGQLETTASNAGFLTGLSVVLTPFAAFLRTRKLPSLENGLGIALASVGFVLLTLPAGGGAINRGDLMVFGCGVVFAFYIVEMAERSAAHDSALLTAAQLAVVAAVAGLLSVLLRSALFDGFHAAAAEARPVVWAGPFLWSILYLGSIGTVGTFFGQTWAQRHMSATHAAILFALEPVWAALLAAWLLGERLGPRGLAGGALVLAGIVVAESRLRRRAPRTDGPAPPAS